MKKAIKLILIFILVTMALSISSCSEKTERERKDFQNLLDEYEISSVVEFDGKIYVGGLEGVFEIGPENLSYEKIDLGDIFLVKDLLVFNDELYIGHEEGIKVYKDGEYREILNKESDLDDIRVNDLYVDRNDDLWVGTYGGVLKFSSGVWESLTVDDGLMDNTVFFIIEDGQGGMVFGHYASSNSGISYLKNDKWTYFNTENGLPHNYITDGIIIEDKLYITSGFYDLGGVAIFKIGEDGLLHESNIIEEWGDFGSKARSINVRKDELWIGTEYNGLSIIKDENIYNFNEENGLVHNEVKSILFTDDGRVWLGTRGGVSVIEVDKLLDQELD